MFVKATNHRALYTSRTACVPFLSVQNGMECFCVCIVVGCLFFPQLVSLCQCWPLRLMHEYYISSTQGKYTTEMCIYKPNVFGWRLFANGIIITSIEAQALDHFSHISCTLCNGFITFFQKWYNVSELSKAQQIIAKWALYMSLPPAPINPATFFEIFLFYSFGWRFCFSRCACSRELQIISLEILRQTTLQVQFSSVIYTNT